MPHYTRTQRTMRWVFVSMAICALAKGALAHAAGASEATVVHQKVGAHHSRGIIVDGAFDDWAAVPPVYVDETGDGGETGVDFGSLSVASDAGRVYLLIELGVERSLQGGNEMVLYVDTDGLEGTGLRVGGIGADLEWRFGKRSGTIHRGDDTVEIRQFDLGLRQGPTVTSDTFEIALDRRSVVGGAPAFTGSSVSLLLVDGAAGDRLPDAPQTLGVDLDDRDPPTPSPAHLGREHPDHVRVVSYNVLLDGLFERPDRFERILRALDPDVVCLQEIYGHSRADIERAIGAILPGATWTCTEANDCAVVSRYPISDSHATGPDGENVWALVDLPDDRYAHDLSVVSAHPPCCGRHLARQRELEAIVAWHRGLQLTEARRLPQGTPVVVAGDMNLVGQASQLATLLAGTITDEQSFGPSHPIDWDGTALTDVFPHHTTGLEAYTWRDDTSEFAPGRLDFIVYSDSVLGLGNRFILWTPELSEEALEQYALEATDTAVASDHLPLVADFVVAPPGEP